MPTNEEKLYCGSQFAASIKVLKPACRCGEDKICYSIAIVQHIQDLTKLPTAKTNLRTAGNSATCGVTLIPGHTYFVATRNGDAKDS